MKILQLFSLHQTDTTYKQEIIGGLTNFMAIAYIIIVNPLVLNANGKGFPIAATLTATILTIILMTSIASFIIKLPFVLAPGMGLNVMVSYTLALHDNLPVPIILGIIFWSGILLFIFSITNLRQRIINAIPESIQTALTVGIGVFLILIGIKNAGIIVSNPNTLLSLNKINIDIVLCFIGFILASVLFIRGKIYGMILPIIVITTLSIFFGSSKFPQQLITTPDFSLFMQMDLTNSLKLSLIPAILSLFIVMFFDTTSSVLGLLSQITYENGCDV